MLRLLLACAASEDTEAVTWSIEGNTEGAVHAYRLELDPPPVVGAVTATLHTEAGVTVSLLPWMPAHEHGVSDQTAIVEEEAGVYTTGWTWPMAGEWELQLGIEGADGAGTATIDVVVD